MKKLSTSTNYCFKVLWSKTCIGISVNENYQKNYSFPLTSFYFWPQEDGWKLLKEDLNSKPWMSKQQKQEILNGYTFIIHYWLNNLHKNINLYNPQLNLPFPQVELLGVNTIS